MTPRPRLQTMWADDSIRVEVRAAGVVDEPANQEIFDACLAEMGAVRLRLMLGCYGPGTEKSPKAKYYWLLGESATILCRDLEVTDWFREELLKWLKGLDGVKLQRIESNEDGQ